MYATSPHLYGTYVTTGLVRAIPHTRHRISRSESSGGSGQIGCSPLTLRVLDRLDGEYIVSPWRLEPGALIWFTLIEISLPFRHVHMSKLSFIWCTQDLVPDSSEGCVKSPLVCFAA
jgi:hypothetical protein